MRAAPDSHASDILTMEMTREQATILMRAAEFYSRVACGQYDFISDTVMDVKQEKIFEERGEEAFHEAFNELIEQRRDAETILKNARQAQFPELHPLAHYGHGYSRETDIAFDIYKAIQYAISWHDHPEGGFTVNFNEPMQNRCKAPKIEYKKDSHKGETDHGCH